MSKQRLTIDEVREKRRIRAKNWRARNPGYGAVYKTKYRRLGKAKARMRSQKIALIAAFGGSCQCCEGAFHHAEMDFHHVDSTTKERPLQPDRGWETLCAEAEKCVLVCSNCHRLVHYYERNPECETLLQHPLLSALKSLHAGHIRGPSKTELLKVGPKSLLAL